MLQLGYIALQYLVFSDLNAQNLRNYKGELQRNRSARKLWQNDQKSPRANVQQKKVRKKSTLKFENVQDDIIQIQMASDESYEMDINEEIEIDKNAMFRGIQTEISPDRRKTFKAKHWQIYKTLQQYMDEELIDEDKEDIQEQTPTPLVRQNQKLAPDEIIFQKNLQIPDIIDEFTKLYEVDPHNDNYNLQLVHVEGWEEIWLNHKFYKDTYILLWLRKLIVTFFNSISLICYKITTNIVSNFIMLLLVSINMVLYITKFYDDVYITYKQLFDGWSLIFFWIYVVEHGIKIVGLGLVQFFKVFWNCYDLVNLILFGLYIYGSLSFDFSPLRAMRILIQLAKISSQLQKTLKALTESLKYMMEASLVVLIFCIFFANVGVHLFSQLLLNKCFYIEEGIQDLNQNICGWVNCPNNMKCFKSLNNVDSATNFDNFFFAFAQIIRTITMDNWTDVMYYTMYTLSPMTWIYFVLVIFIVGFFAFNLIIAVLKTYYSQIVSNYQEDKEELSNKQSYIEPLNLRFIKNIGLYNYIKTLQKIRKRFSQQSLNQSNISQIKLIDNLIFSPKGSQLLQKSQKVKSQFTNGFGQINKLQKMVRRAKTVKEKKKQQRLILSARQQRLLQKRENEEMGIFNNNEQSIFDKCNLKAILQPQRNFNIEQSKFEQAVQGDVKGKKILMSLKYNDVLAWKLDLKYSQYHSTSKRDVISELKEILEKEKKLKEQYEKVKRHNLKQYYMLDIYDKQKEKITSQQLQSSDNGHPSIQRLYSIKYDINTRSRDQSTASKIKWKFPIKMSKRMFTSELDMDNSKNEIPSNKSTITRKSYFDQLRKQRQFFQKSQTRMARGTSDGFMEFPEWQEGQSYIIINDIKWNHEACSILINRKINDLDDEEDLEDDQIIDLDWMDQNYEHFVKIRKKELEQGYIRRHNISILNILRNVSKSKLIAILKQLNKHQYNIWIQGFYGYWIVIQFKLHQILEEKTVSIIFDLYTMINFFILCSDGYLSSDLVDQINSVMTFLLLGEIILKIIGYGIQDFSKKTSNKLDAFVLVLCLLQYFISITQPFWLVQYSSEIKVLRASKAFMLYRVIKYNKFIVRIMKIAQLTMKSYINITFLMFYVIFMYAIMGLQFFVNKFDESQRLAQLHSFNSIGKSWMTVFNTITNDDAVGMLKVATQYTDTWIGLLFYITMVFGLNYLIYGLVSAVLLDAFSSELEKGNQYEEKRERILQKLGIQENINHNDTQLDTLSSYKNEKEQNDDILNDIKLQQQQFIKRQTLNSKKSIYQQVPETVKHIFSKQKSLEIQYYKDIECEYSLFIFHFNNQFRKFCYRTTQSFIFKLILNSSICSSVATMIIISFDDNLPSLHTNNLNTFYEYHLLAVNLIIAITYILEIISQGMLLDQGAFCRDIWRFIDIIYLLSYYLSFLTLSPFLKFSLYLIYLRPLMMINMFQSISGIKNAMSLSLVQILNIIGVILLVFLIFDVIGMHLYQNKMGYCEDLMNFYVNKDQCLIQNKTWIIHPYNFENILNGLLTLFLAASLDGWGEIMQVCFNANDSKFGPTPLKTQWATYLFFILFIFIGAMFFMGFLTGVLFTEFQKYTKKLENKFLTSDQSQFLKISELILKQSPGYSNPPKTPLRRLCYRIVFSQLYHKFFIIVLCFNTIVLCLFYSDASYEYMSNLNKTYQVLTGVFALDTIIKLLAYGPTRYFATNWRVIELSLSFIAVADFIYDNYWGWFTNFLGANQSDQYFTFYRILFCLRDIRILLIIQEFKGLLRLLRVLWFSMPLLLKILYIQVIAQTTYALIGKELFSHITNGSVIDDKYANFKNFINSALLMFKCTTGDDWRALLIDCSTQNYFCKSDPNQCGSSWSLPFFLSYYLFSNIIIMNLFVLALVDQFENFFNASTNAIQTFVENVDHFCNVWCKYTYDTKGTKMHTRFIARFLLDLHEPLGALEGDNVWDAAKSASNFRIRANKQGYVYFNELLYETIRFAFKESVFKSGSLIGRSQMKQFDISMKRKMKENNMKSEQQEDQEYFQDEYSSKHQNFNILSEYLNVLIALKTWEAYTQKLIEKTKNLDEYTEQTSSSDNDKKLSMNIGASVSRASQNRLTQTIDLDDLRVQRNYGHLNIYKETKSFQYYQHCIILEPISKSSPQDTTIQKSPSSFLENQKKHNPKKTIIKRQSSLFKQNVQSFKDVLDKVF
ncbi:unnamed protein product [Paramecium pentaurelia]|uniref:Ion transport domain-containing protein n=1 Tax=Paramecium pentaurelia TaxID=43138 RepID=A0A8S1VC34_9CILI|nr:unnamed protein product [Paramecium pentaurelia]